ncbi:neprilysin-11-like [Dermacentor andersoni]|uniref:neprilysin-11-like n=1 Tax=Dermacentor andersoni TaxID=34620 RepID=UPI003B3A23C6
MPAYVDGTSAAHRFGALGSQVATHLFLLLHQSVRRAGGHDQLSRRLGCYAPTRDHRESGTEEAALSLAWQAYRSSAPDDTRLEGLEQFSGDQLFFVAFAFLHCTSSEGVHAESQLVNSAVRNVDGFASSFNCAHGAPMNPEAKCSYF